MKQLLITAVLASVIAAPALATPTDALMLCTLLSAAAFGSSLINETAFSKLSWAASRVYARINHGSYIRR
jgi:hypothetical protein